MVEQARVGAAVFPGVLKLPEVCDAEVCGAGVSVPVAGACEESTFPSPELNKPMLWLPELKLRLTGAGGDADIAATTVAKTILALPVLAMPIW